MKEGFFPSSTLTQVRPQVSLLPACGSCKLWERCKSPKMKPYGKGRRGILLIGESPASQEDDEGRPFVGDSGQHLRSVLRRFGIDMDRDCWATNALICKAEQNPDPKRIPWCRPNLTQTLKELQPDIIIPLGGVAVKSLIGGIWGEDTQGITRWAGFDIPCQKPNAWICPTYHPSYCLRAADPVVDLQFAEHLQQAVAHKGKPWSVVPDYRKQVTPIYDAKTAAFNLRQYIRDGRSVAIDFESDRLKPDHSDARIVCCSVSNGEMTIAYPWLGEAIEATGELLRSPLPKIAANLKHEERWCIQKFGHPVNNWQWDTMLAAHWLDNRPSICSLEFQAFVVLGAPNHKAAIGPYLEAKGGNARNRIHEVDLGQLLVYCSIDSLVEWHIAQKQMEQGRISK